MGLTENMLCLRDVVLRFMEINCRGYQQAKKKNEILEQLRMDHSLDISERLLRRLLTDLRKDGLTCSNNTIGLWYIDYKTEIDKEIDAILQGEREKRLTH